MNCTYTHIDSSEVRYFNSTFSISSNHLNSKDRDLIIPDCTPGIMFLKEGSFIRRHKFGYDEFNPGDLVLFGQKTFSVTYEMENVMIRASGVKLMPYSINQLFDIPAHSVTDKVIKISGKESRKKVFDIIRCADPFIPFDKRTKHLEIVAKITNIINASKGLISIKQILAQDDLNYKFVERLFKKHVGLTPKVYCRVIRFNNAFGLLNKHYNLTDIAYQCGYFDQNHFIKEIKHFTGLTPKNLFNHSRSGLEPNHIGYIRERSI